MRRGFNNGLEMDGGRIENGDMPQQEHPASPLEKVNLCYHSKLLSLHERET